MFGRSSCTTTTPLQRQVSHRHKETENLLQTHDYQSQQNQESDSSFDNTTTHDATTENNKSNMIRRRPNRNVGGGVVEAGERIETFENSSSSMIRTYPLDDTDTNDKDGTDSNSNSNSLSLIHISEPTRPC